MGAFFGGSAPAFFAGADSFLNRPFTDGRLVGGRGARVFEADLAFETSGARFPGLGVLARGTAMALGGGIPYIEVRPCLGVVFADGVWNDWMLLRLRRGVPSMGESGLSYVATWERKLETDSSKPALEPGLLPVLDCPPDPSV
jgi:hypothetical protein